uniref:Caspase-8 n=1 Tax=Gasterosteus aculeatus aculeatus TaxID=481459 RepID=G3NKC9_GASAC|nr:truncated caspase-10 isoform X1 [Gasterosteus aculeatus aculeatus]
MHFQKLLFDIGKALSGEEVKALAFLCTDILGRNLSSVESASGLFSRLRDQGFLSAEQPHLLTELLIIIQRVRLTRDVDLPAEPSSLISPYRKMLYNLSEELTADDLKDMKFLLHSYLPRRKLEENVSTLEIWLEMEHKDLMNEHNLHLLEILISKVCPMLKDKINQLKAQQETPTSPATQESGRQGSLSAPNAPNQVPQSLGAEGTGLFEMQDSPSGFNGGGDCAALSLGLSGHLKIEVVETMPPPKNMSCSEPPTSQPSDTNTEVLGTYPMTSAKRGICLIVNNFDFTKFKNYQNREGTMKDEERLHKVFAWLGFEVEVKHDCEGEQMLTALRELASRNHGQADCLVCCVLSHGDEGCVYGVDGHTVAIKELKEPFNGLNCASLAGKPKLFFIQACQGTGEQKAVNVVPDGPEDSAVCSDAFKASDAIPSEADFLLGMSTVPSFVSYRHRKNGSWFIESLCQNLVQMVPKGCDLVSIMTLVNADVAKKTDEAGVKKQMPQPAFSLRRKVVFPIPKGLPPSLSH